MEFLNTGLKIILFGTFKDTKHKIESFSRELETRQEKWQVPNWKNTLIKLKNYE